MLLFLVHLVQTANHAHGVLGRRCEQVGIARLARDQDLDVGQAELLPLILVVERGIAGLEHLVFAGRHDGVKKRRSIVDGDAGETKLRTEKGGRAFLGMPTSGSIDFQAIRLAGDPPQQLSFFRFSASSNDKQQQPPPQTTKRKHNHESSA